MNANAAPVARTAPAVGVIVPCFNEAGYVDRLLHGLVPQVASAPHWRVVLVDDSSTDATATILADVASTQEQFEVISGSYGSPGGSRSAGATHLIDRADAPDWLVTLDADVEVADDWLARWDAAIGEAHANDACGALNGVEIQDHLYADHPNARLVSGAFGHAVGVSERAVGVTNLNGVNHGVRTHTYLTAGPYVQPTMPGPDGPLALAGEDWDLGVRIRRAGYSVLDLDAAVHDRGRRLLADVHAYVSGEAYEGAFTRVAATVGPRDIDDEAVTGLVDAAITRSLRHFLLKPLLAEAAPLDPSTGLAESTLASMAAWMRRWPHPTFEESRNGFVFGRLVRFAHVFTPTVRAELHLDTDHVLATLRGTSA